MLYEILLLKAFRHNYAKMRQRSPLRNFITFLAKKQAPIHVSAVSSSFALMSFARQTLLEVPNVASTSFLSPMALFLS